MKTSREIKAELKIMSGIYIDHNSETYVILSKEDTARAIEKRFKGSEEIPNILHFRNCDIELFEDNSKALAERIESLENQFYEDLTKYN